MTKPTTPRPFPTTPTSALPRWPIAPGHVPDPVPEPDAADEGACDTATLLSDVDWARAAAAYDVRHEDDADDRDDAYNKALAARLAERGVSAAQAAFVATVRRGCAAAWRREDAAGRAERQREERAACRARPATLPEQIALADVATFTRWHIAYRISPDGLLAGATVQGWRASSRFTGKPQGEFLALRAVVQSGGLSWDWPERDEQAECLTLPSLSPKVRDAVLEAALRATAFSAGDADTERALRASLCLAAGVVDPAVSARAEAQEVAA